ETPAYRTSSQREQEWTPVERRNRPEKSCSSGNSFLRSIHRHSFGCLTLPLQLQYINSVAVIPGVTEEVGHEIQQGRSLSSSLALIFRVRSERSRHSHRNSLGLLRGGHRQCASGRPKSRDRRRISSCQHEHRKLHALRASGGSV